MRVLLCIAAMFVIQTQARAQEFVGYEGKNAVSEGDGGAKKTVDGIDIWSDGAPPFKFKLLGYITDTRHKSGLWGKISMSNLDSDVVDLAKKNGGDGVIVMDANTETVGIVGSGVANSNGNANVAGNTAHWNSTSTGTGFSAPVQKQHSKYAVVKYLKDEPSSIPVPQGATVAATPGATPEPGKTP